MKYAIIADTHGNYPALQAVLEDAGRRGITHFLFAGDYCISGPWPDECVTAIRALPEKTVIRGNEEKYLENLHGKDPAGWTDGQMQATYYAYRQISPENREYLLAQPHRADFELCGVPVHMAHSSMDFIGTRAFYTWNSVTVAERNKLPGADPERILAEFCRERDQDPEFLQSVAGLEKGIYIFGHSHVQWSWQDEAAGVYLINPGSCGLPLDGRQNCIPYTVLEITEDGQIRIEEEQLPFDKAAYIGKVKQTRMYREANIWSRVIMRELAFAREHVHYFLIFADQFAREIGDERRPYAVDTWERAYEAWSAQQETEGAVSGEAF